MPPYRTVGKHVSAPPERGYHRYHIETEPAADVAPFPSRFHVAVKRHRLAGLILKEILHYRGRKDVIMSRPCVYGVFSGPVGGFAPREHLCVGCLRCTTEYPEVVQIHRNPEHARLGDAYFTAEYVDAVCSEARTGRIPVKGAGYRGRFGGEGWDGMWTDMSEIVRPTRDGIHGREFISTVVDIGAKQEWVSLDPAGEPVGEPPPVLTLPIPMLFDAPPSAARSPHLARALADAALATETLAVLPLAAIAQSARSNRHVVPLATPAEVAAVSGEPALIELLGWSEAAYRELRDRFPAAIIGVRLAFAPGVSDELVRLARTGVGVFHLVADFHGRGADGRFALEWIREVHQALVAAGCRDVITLLGSGGMIGAEHVAKAILCGLDAVALDTPALVALQARFDGECRDRSTSRFVLPDASAAWGAQRLQNLLGAWRDQLLEVLGAMGLREVRRLRGEMGRAMLQRDLEREAFTGIAGYG
ncbi:MAG: glutamate synthase-related protein [Gemmatimonadales bacterium]